MDRKEELYEVIKRDTRSLECSSYGDLIMILGNSIFYLLKKGAYVS